MLSLSGCRGSHTETPIALIAHPHQFVLDNGLTVLWEEDHRQPLVALEVRILGGLRGEGRYLGTGITHFIEHMLFKGTPTRPPGTIDREVRRYGGTINAFTSHDYTGVNLFVESAYLSNALEMLADILQHAIFPPEEFAKERPVVISEIQMNRDDPDRRLYDVFWNEHFLVHPYRHPILGYLPLLESLTVQDLRDFYRAQYVPNNILIACVGDLNGGTFRSEVQRVFGSWPRQSPYQIIAPQEPPAVSVKERWEELPTQAAYAMLGFPSVRLAHPDVYPLDALATIAGQGRSSRLYETVVRVKQLAHVVSAGNYTPADPGIFSVYLRAEPGKMSAAIDETLTVLEDIARHGVTPQELAKAKRNVVADRVFQRQTIESVAADYATSMALTGDPAYSQRYVEGIEQVTAEQVQAAARRYLDRRRMTVAIIQPPATAAPAAPAGPEPSLTVTKMVLPNGLTVLLGVNRHLPMATIVAAARGGVRVEREATQGVSNLTAQLLVKGTRHRSASEIAAFVESRGGELEAFSGRDGFGLSLQLLSPDVEAGIELMQELLTQSTFSEPELKLQQQLILNDLQARDDDVFDRAGRLLRRTLFLNHPYRFDPAGTRESVRHLTRRDCEAFARQWLVPSNTVLAVFGDVDPSRTQALIHQQFESWPRGETPWAAQLPSESLTAARQTVVRLPKEQTVLMLGFRGTTLGAPDRYAVDLLTAALSGMSGRLFQGIREQYGLSYTLGASHVPGWDPGWLVVYAATRPQEREQVRRLLHAELDRVARDGITREELSQAKRQLIGVHRLELQHLAGLSKRCVLDELYGVGYNAWQQEESRLNAVTLEEVRRAAQQYVTLSREAEVVIGPDVEPSNPVEVSGDEASHRTAAVASGRGRGLLLPQGR